VQAVAVFEDRVALDIVESKAYLIGRILAMIEERNEPSDRTFKINIVFPERVIRIDEQSLGSLAMRHDYHDTGCGHAATLWGAMLGKIGFT